MIRQGRSWAFYTHTVRKATLAPKNFPLHTQETSQKPPHSNSKLAGKLPRSLLRHRDRNFPKILCLCWHFCSLTLSHACTSFILDSGVYSLAPYHSTLKKFFQFFPTLFCRLLLSVHIQPRFTITNNRFLSFFHLPVRYRSLYYGFQLRQRCSWSKWIPLHNFFAREKQWSFSMSQLWRNPSVSRHPHPLPTHSLCNVHCACSPDIANRRMPYLCNVRILRVPECACWATLPQLRQPSVRNDRFLYAKEGARQPTAG